jgi:hypothetical protein
MRHWATLDWWRCRRVQPAVQKRDLLPPGDARTVSLAAHLGQLPA